jgi:hypothetical protein
VSRHEPGDEQRGALVNSETHANAYDYRNCQSLFGYAARVHERSGGTCQLCGAGGSEVDFDLWRQLTVEHLIGEGQGGYLWQITTALAARFPSLDPESITQLARRIDEANTVTACSFCNSTTSRNKAPIAMSDAIARAPDGTPEVIFAHVTADLDAILAAKRADVAWKLRAVRRQFDIYVAPRLTDRRAATVGRVEPVCDESTRAEPPPPPVRGRP